MRSLRDSRILVTAFEPWAEHRVNSSRVAVEELDGETIGGCLVRVRILPVEWEAAPRRLLEAVGEVEPSAVICFGMHPGPEWRVELIARNRDVRDGEERAIIEGGPRILPSGLPAAAVLGALLDAELESKPSEDAGAFLCNHVFYRAMHVAGQGVVPALAGFVHVPAPRFADDEETLDNADALREGARRVVETVAAAVSRARRIA